MKRSILAMATMALGLMLPAVAQHDTDDVAAANERSGRLLIVYDSSNSMWGELADTSRKYEAGRSALSTVLGDGIEGRDIAFRAYGHRRTDDCRDTELIVPFTSADSAQQPITDAVNAIRPTGRTPITHSLTEGLGDLNGGPGDILLISDGIETCDADPCDLVRDWQTSGISIRVHVVGVGLNELERTAMACIAEESGGQYLDANSAGGFVDALGTVSDVIEASEPTPVETGVIHRIVINATDTAGRAYPDLGGEIRLDGETVATTLRGSGRGANIVEGPGEYTLLVGAMLEDGSVFDPVSVPVMVEGAGDTVVDVTINTPARVTAQFSEDGEDAGAYVVSAFQEDERVFQFYSGREVLAAPGTYEFRARPNVDNRVSLTANLDAGSLTTLEFDLVQTVRAYLKFTLPDGTEFTRVTELWKGDEKRYTLNGGNGGLVQPGTYEIRGDDQNLPLSGLEVTIAAEDDITYTLPVEAGWIAISYAPSDTDYVANPDRAFLNADDRGGQAYARPDTAIPVAPGNYTVVGFDRAGLFEDVSVSVESGARVDVEMEPAPLGELTVTYAASDAYDPPGRAFIRALDGQHMFTGPTMTPGEPRRLVPGRYRIDGWRNVGDFASQEITITPGGQQSITLELATE
ncbi:MAG: hypothetical protein AAFX86_03015 [Pseudomonadota bacterium]